MVRLYKNVEAMELLILAIVVALTVGVLMVGQELFMASKLRNLIAQLRQYNISAQVFEEKYNFLPGDFAQAERNGLSNGDCRDENDKFLRSPSGIGCNGDGNGLVLDVKGGVAKFNGEIASFWFHLTKEELIDKKFDGISNKTNIGFPGTFLEVGGIHIFGNKATETNYYQVGGISNEASALLFANVLVPEAAYNIDLKLDDAMPEEGLVRAQGGKVAIGNPSKGKKDMAVCVAKTGSKNEYNVFMKKPLCQVSVRYGL